ncbi:MAG TPA: gamma-glutamyltransferase [Rubricoccaceae bacterium]|nr:gamma-glutamyltransferase [Rubricoccaceae bacterium]
MPLIPSASRRLALLLAAALLVPPLSACRAEVEDPTRGAGASAPADTAGVRSARAMVVAGQPDAARAGLEVLRDGGNAIDAAVATGFALAVTLPNAGNVGGGGFLLVRFADGRATSLDFREVAPLAATRDLFIDPLTGRARPDLSRRGHLAVGVPGTVAGLLEAHARWGSLPLERLMEPAIRLAEEGHVLSDRQARLLNIYREDFLASESARRYFTKPDSTLFRGGERWVQRDLAGVLKRIRDHGRAGFYEGETADLIVAEMERGGGLITHEDLRRYRPVERAPVYGWYRGYRVIGMGPPSSGGIALAQLLRAVEPYALRAMGHHSPAQIHLFGEAMRRAFADRAHWLGDPAFADVPAEALMDSLYVRRRMASFDPDTVSSSLAVGHGTPPGLGPESTETTHYSIVDEAGNAVAVTYTINDYFGAKVAVGGAGFLLNDEMDDFTAAPGAPNLWGLVQGEANAVRPGARPVSSMTPTILEDPEGRLFMVVGSPGGSRIITTVFQVVTNVVDFGMPVQAAVAAPRFHHQWLPEQLEVEEGFPDATLGALGRLGWDVRRVSTFGAADAIVVTYDDAGRPTLHGGADPRREDDVAVGY